MAIWTATRIAAPSVMRRDATVSTRLVVSTPPTSGSVTCSTLTRDLLRASAPIYPSMTGDALRVTSLSILATLQAERRHPDNDCGAHRTLLEPLRTGRTSSGPRRNGAERV